MRVCVCVCVCVRVPHCHGHVKSVFWRKRGAPSRSLLLVRPGAPSNVLAPEAKSVVSKKKYCQKCGLCLRAYRRDLHRRRRMARLVVSMQDPTDPNIVRGKS